MTWLRKTPKRPSSMKNTLIEVRQAVKLLRAKRQDVYDNEVSLEYPRESRVNLYEEQLESLDNTQYLMNKAITEMENYPTKEVKPF